MIYEDSGMPAAVLSLQTDGTEFHCSRLCEDSYQDCYLRD